MEETMRIVNIVSFTIWAVLVGLMIGAYVSVSDKISFVDVDTPQYRVSYVSAKQDTIDGIFMSEEGLRR